MAHLLLDEKVLDTLLLKSLPDEYEVLLRDDDSLSEEEKEYYYLILLILQGHIDEVKKWVKSYEFEQLMDDVENLPLNFYDSFKIKMRSHINNKFESLIIPLLMGFYTESNKVTYSELNLTPVLSDGDLLNYIGIKQYNYDLLTNLCDDLDKNFKDIILDGIINNKSVSDIADELEIAGISPLNKHTAQQRAKMIARTEVNAIINKAKIQAYKDNNIEWIDVNTQHDNRVCQICLNAQFNNPHHISEADELIPFHPNCRCYYTISSKNYNYSTIIQ